MISLITSDLHLTDRPQDEYRFGLFPWLREMITAHGAREVVILGDLTDKKDNHSSTLVNKVVAALRSLLVPVTVLRGNHDCVDADNPFFGFLSAVPNLHFITGPFSDEYKRLWLPHSRQPEQDWADVLGFDKAKWIFLHQTLTGAKASSGQVMQGMDKAFFSELKATIISGDIHVPQKVGNVTYVGSPYHIRFGDVYQPRVLLDEGMGKLKDLSFPCLKKHVLEITSPADLAKAKVKPGDQVKVRLKLHKSEFVEWAELRRQVAVQCEKREVHLHGVEVIELHSSQAKAAKVQVQKEDASPTAAFNRFVQREKLDEAMAEVGREILEG